MTRAEKQSMNRRDFVRASAAGAALLATPAHAVVANATEPLEGTGGAGGIAAVLPPPYVGAGTNAPVQPFALGDVTLGDGLLQAKRDRMKAFLQQYDERRFLVLFNNHRLAVDPAEIDAFRLHRGALPLRVARA